ncbi:MAG: nucleotidyl transferase AbiEii/AbiGii toxin family protein [Verrucomicrobia bacterium]|nr:nucleotidyl transferase AbiEii/AbiGii toxin family protein [Verrucomicrobiota bacterium]
MPLTHFQREVLAVIVSNRSEASHFAGGLVLNAADGSPRFSKDFDFFHDAVEALADASERDAAALRAAGFEVIPNEKYGDWTTLSSFRRADVRRGTEEVSLDWAHDSAWRFFPIVPDPVLGWRLHLFDMAVNKALAVSGRTETRDYVDILELGRLFSLEAIVWAACGKDEGFSPLFLLKMMRRFAKTERGVLDKIKARDLDPIAMKMEWIEMCERAEEEMIHLADTQLDMPIGVAFVDGRGEPGWIGRDPTLRIHRLSLRGCWPAMQGQSAAGA